jgi:hypothetical protein
MLKYKSPIATETPTNNGGFLGGLGYLGNKVGIGFMQTFEGAWDYAAGGIADLFGADEWARRQMENDWFGDWYYSADKNFNPGKGWKIAGDVAGGIGNVTAGVSAAALAVASAVGIAASTGGAGLPVSASVIGGTAAGLAAGLGAAGNATKEAYAKTGELTGKEYGYGALVGATEGVIETASNLLAPGAGKVGKGLYKAIAGEAAENAAKTGLSKVIGTAVKHAGTNFISEAVEEGTAEILAPQYAKLTYDPNAENATAEEVIYASFIGGLSGVLAGGGEAAILGTSNSVANYRAGKKAVEAGYTAEIEGVAKRIAEEEAKKPSGYALFEKIREVYERQGSGYGRIGALQRMTTAAHYLPAVEESAKAIVSNPEYSAARFLAIGAKNPDGTPLEITPEKLTEGFDPSADSETALHSLRRALSTNPLLLTLAVADATGKMMLDAENYAGLLTGSGVLTTRGDYQTFLAKASDEQKAAVAQHFGLTAPLDAIPYEDMVNIATGYAATPEGRAAIEAVGNVRYRAEQIEKNEKPLPKVVGEALADGIYRYGDVAIIKEGGSVRIYDHETRSITMAMTPQEATAALQKYRREQDTAKAEERRAKAEEQRNAREEELDTWAREHIKRYRELVGNEQREIRTLIRQGRALGLSDADIETYATVSARSSVRVTFSKAQCRRESVKMENGKPVLVDGKPVILVGYADGFYSPETNEIVVNPEGKRSAAKLLMHELSHALYKDRRFAEVIDGEVKHMDEKRKKEVRELYEKAGRAKAEISEELSVHHAEDVVANRDNLARMMKEEPTLGDKILSFFKLAKTDYKGHNRLSLAAGRLYRTFETILAGFSEFNRGNLAAEAVVGVGGRRDAVAGESSKTADSSLLEKAKAMLEGGADSEKVRQETGWFQGYDGKWRYEIDDSTAVWHLDTAKPDPKRLVHFGERIFKLTDLLDHPAMYEAYPQLKDVTVWENPDAPVDGYVVGKSTDHITVRSLSSMGNLSKDLVIHEVQHLIQNIEGFTSGASKDQFEYKSWGPKEWEAYEKRSEIAAKLYAVLRRHGEHITARDIAAMRQEFSETDSILDSNFMLLSSLADSNKRVDYLRDEYYKQVRILQLTTPSGQYNAVAGEIEAYDVQARRKMSAEERKNTRPNIDREDAIVIEGENNFAESTMAIRHAEDGAVVKSPVTETVISAFKGGVRDSITTEFVALPKQEMSVTTGEGQILHQIEGIKATPVKGIGGQTIAGFTGREVREWAMGLNGFTAEQIENVDRFMDEMGKFMKKAGVTYRFIGLADVENAKLHYTYDAQGNIKSIVLSAMVKNGDYPVNFDLSSICKKRVAMSTLIDKLANRGTLDNGTVALTPTQIFAINTALKNAGYETACLGCFVESKRYNAMAWAKSFVDKWNKAVKAVNPNATYFGYGDGTNTTEVTVAQANRIDVATKEYIAKTKTKRMEQALSKYKEKAAKGLPLISGKKQMVNGKEIETFTKAARDRLIKSETLSDAMKERYLNADVSTLWMEDVETLLEHGVLPGASISNKQAVTELVKSGEAYQHLLRPSDLLTAKGIEKLEALPNFHGVLYGHYGSGTPKLMQSFTPYNSEIALLPSKKGDTGLAEYLYSIAGVRMQSFSDFQVQNIYDYLQMVADLAARKLPAHAYTKELSFARLLGMTGIKVNLSVMFDIDPTVDAAHAGLTRRIPFIHKGEYAKVVLHDEQGDWVYNIGDYQTQRAFHEAYPDADLRFLQSIGFADAVKLQTTEGYSANCGIIGVGYSDLHILAMLDDNRIRYIIPYHASSLPADIKVATNIALGTDYTPYQNTMKIDSIVDKNGKTVEWSVKEAYRRLGSGKAVLDELNAKIKSEGWVVKTKKAQNGHGTFGLYEDLGKTSDPRKTAENFMDWCAGNGSLPLFYQFASHANYYKLLYDYNVYDCVSEQYAPQTAVTNTYPAGDAAKPTNAADTRFDTTYLTGVIDKQMSFMDRYSQNLDRDLDVIASKVERGDMSGRRDALPTDAEYMTAVESGDMETAQRMVDEAARKAGYNSPKLYHGTDAFGFTEIDSTAPGADGYSFWAADKESTSATYTNFGRVRGVSSNLSDEDIESMREEIDNDIDGEIDNFRRLIDRTFSEWFFGQQGNGILREKFDDANPDSGYGDGIYDVFTDIIAEAYYNYSDYLDNAYEDYDVWADESEEGKALIESVLALEGLKTKQHTFETDILGGIYQLYANTANMYEIDGRGANWNNLKPEGLPDISHPYKTRDVAEWAKDNGYDGVIFRNIVDSGKYGEVGAGDVYAFFKPQRQVKSADPITYDDDGKVIPLSKRFDMENPDIRYALPEDATYVSPTAGAVGKTKAEYKSTFGDKVFTASTRTYIDTVDELYGIETYLRKVGKMDKAAVEALVQQARAARSQAQTMIGTAQYNVFSDKVERMGDGLLEILKPTKNWTAKKKGAFDDYLLNQLNIDRMTLESRSFVWAAPLRRTVQTLENNLAALENRKKQLTSDIGKKQTALNNAKVRRGVVKTAKAKEVWNKQVDTFARELSALNGLLKEAKRDIAKKKKELGKAKEEYEAALLKNKPVFGKDETLDEDGNMKRDHDITADESRDIVKKYEAAYPEFAEMAKRLYAYLDNVQKMRVEAGLITQDMADHMKKLYPHYVPSYRDVEGGGISSIKGKNAMEVSKTVRKAQGGNQDILDVAVSIAMQTDEVLKAGQINKLSRALYDAAKSSGDDTYVKIISEEVVGAQEDAVDAVMRPKPGQLTFYADGKRVTLEISKELLYGFDGLRKPSVDFESPVVAALAKMNDLYKRGVTSLNPAFAIRNPIRDFQDAGLNSKHPLLFAKQMAGLAQKGIATNSERWELYRAMGGFSSTVFDGALHKQAGYAGFESISELFAAVEGETDLKAAWRKLSAPAKAIFRSVENANAFLEQTTRFAEFCASLDAGDSPAVALNNSAEVTTNFGRRGRITKVLNATVIPFLNPAVQGFDKLFRNVGDAFTGGHWVRGVATLITKAAIIGIAPMLLNSIMYDDDEEYEKLRETDKENNFLIKTADGTFIKIPRGRLASVIGGLYNRGDKLAKGEDAELAGYASNVVSQITPVENVSRTIFSPIFDLKNNRTWYGGEIEGREWDDTAPRDRYDESTSSIAVAIGQAINYSPKKIHYLLDQYSGVVGDFVLPATSKKEKRDFFSGNFTLDSVTSNKLSERFYDVYDKTAYADTAGDEAATYRLKYLNDVKKAVRDMNKELDEIRNSDLSNTEKLQQTRVVRSLINAAYDSALKSLDAVNADIEETAGIEDEVIREAEINRRVFGAEYALKQYNEKTYEKYVLLNGGGIGYDELYAYHFATLGIESDLDKKGNVIEGSKKKKILAVINSLDLPKEQKLILLYSRGYTAKDGDIKGVSAARAKTVLAAYIAKAQGLTKAQRDELAKACGLKVTNGRISVK